MTWKERLLEYEHKHDWVGAIELMHQTVEANPSDKWAYICAIYLLHNILLEESYSLLRREELTGQLQTYFKVSSEIFKNDPEYLFFIGKILHIAEWYFGLKNNELALDFQRRAYQLNPENELFEWAYRLTVEGSLSADGLAHSILTSDSNKVDWLNSSGFPGSYVLNHLRMSNARYLKMNGE